MLHNLIFRLFEYMAFSGTVLFFGIGSGPSEGEKQQAGAEGALASFATSTGEKDIMRSSDFWNAIISGDPGQISKVLGPEESAMNKRGQESIKTGNEFGNRGGGTNSRNQQTGDTVRSGINEMVSSLTGTAAGQLGSMGTNLLGIGSSAHSATFDMAKTIHDQQLAKWNDIFKSTMDVASSVMKGFGGGGAQKAFGNLSPGQISGAYGGPTSADTESLDTSGWDSQL